MSNILFPKLYASIRCSGQPPITFQEFSALLKRSALVSSRYKFFSQSSHHKFFAPMRALACQNPKPCNKTRIPPPTTVAFWTSKETWKRSSINTLRCLVGCTLGDFSALWFLQSFYPDLGVGTIMAASSEQSSHAYYNYLMLTITSQSGRGSHILHGSGDGPPANRS